MSATTQVTTWSDLYTDLSNRVRLQTGITATENQAKRYIDIANHDLYIGAAEKLYWAKRRNFITTHPEYTTGTVSVTVGSTSVTGTSTVWTTNNDFGQPNARAGGKIVIAGSEVYNVSAVGGAGSMTISPAYIGSTDTEATYRYFEDEYALASDFARPYDLRSFDDNGHIEIVGDMDFRRRFPRNRTTSSRVLAACLIDLPFSGNTAPVRRVVFGPPPSSAEVIPYTYITKNIVVATDGTEKASFTATTDEPIVPLRYRHVLVLGALYHWYRDQKGDDSRALQAKGEYEQLKARMISDQEVGQQRPSIKPHSAYYVSRARRPYRNNRGGRRYDTGGFDTLEE